ncbi:AAA family ATPase [Roseomonas frigidaquae]|uniref:AAA family ATPase n=1 Tax=Falsiroseomonas frigidaquae TaxID=487318 RepID=A0ABX1F143_9PROT|nr:AAA family ATPase [Falsiroseomonas frigidaquae]NKE46073.1 AAA family ATPase [Falsiroseomonas frigidaquae]
MTASTAGNCALDLIGDLEQPPATTAPDEQAATALRRRLWTQGFRPIALATGEKRPTGRAWQERARLDPPEAASRPADPAALNTGVLCDGLRVLDIDVDDVPTAERVEALAFARFGPAPVRWRENSGKRALFYRAAEGEPGKRVSAGAAGKVEVLGHGQQAQAFGIHPSGVALRWRPAPLDGVSLGSLQPITEDALAAFLADVAPVIGTEAAGASALHTGGRAEADQTALLAPSPELLAEAIAHAPNDGSREGWIRMGHAIKAAGGTVDQWAEWSERHQPEDAEDLARRFSGFSPPFSAGFRHIAHAARKAGWYGDAAAQFAPVIAQMRAQAEAAASAGRFGRLQLRTVAEAANARPRHYLIKHLLARGELSIWWGAPKTGKSFLVLRLAWCLATGRDAWDFRVKTPRRVLYVAAEGEGGFNGRAEALRRAAGDPADRFQYIAQPVTIGPPGNDLAHLAEAAQAMRADLIVIDTLARTFGGGDENTAQDMNGFVANLDTLRAETGAHVLVIHHGRKDGGDLRGSGALAAAADLIVKVEKGTGADPSVATIEAAKDDEDGRRLAFRLRSVELGMDEDGDPLRTCIAEPSNAPVSAKANLPRTAAAVLSVITELAAAEGVAPAGVDAGGMAAVPDARIRAECESRHVSTAAKPESRKRVLRDALASLRDAGHIGMRDGWVWPVGATV